MILKTLTLENFRGLTVYSLPLPPSGIAIRGANGSGKSTVMNAFLWLLSGKDSQGRAYYAAHKEQIRANQRRYQSKKAAEEMRNPTHIY